MESTRLFFHEVRDADRVASNRRAIHWITALAMSDDFVGNQCPVPSFAVLADGWWPL
jgi:hypothetical protein